MWSKIVESAGTKRSGDLTIERLLGLRGVLVLLLGVFFLLGLVMIGLVMIGSVEL